MIESFQPVTNPNFYLPKRLWVTSTTHASVLLSGNYTIAECRTPERTTYGVAKRNPTDVYDPHIGFRIALARAVKKLRGNNGRT